MGVMAPNIVRVDPSFMEPGLVIMYTQRSGAFTLLAGGKPLVKLGEGDMYVYIQSIELRTKISANQASDNNLMSCDIVMNYASTPTYNFQTRGEYNHHDAAAMGRRGASVVEAQRLGMRQAHFQLLRSALLYGMQPVNGEGLINAQGATNINLPPDPNGNNTVTTYDNGAMAFFLGQQVQQIKTRTYQMGHGMRFGIVGPQRTLGAFEYNVVQLTQFQREGAGSASTKETFERILNWNGDKIEWTYDDTLIGKGAGGADLVLLVMPEVEKPDGVPPINTAPFNEFQPGIDMCTAQYMDMAAPREIITPVPGGVVDTLAELRASSGWGIRPEAITIINMPFS